jgi:hypothetical protein
LVQLGDELVDTLIADAGQEQRVRQPVFSLPVGYVDSSFR